MAKIVPFSAVRAANEFVREVASLPYDVWGKEEAREWLRNKPLSFLRVEKSESDFPEDKDDADASIFERARHNLDKMISGGIMFQDETAHFYLYRLQRGSHIQTGIVACVSIEEYIQGKIKTHENTLEAKERERTLHIDAAGAQTGPVFITYRGLEEIDRLVEREMKPEPEYDFVTEDGVRHTVWVVADNESINTIQKAFLQVESLYIADGHHRAAAAARVARLRNEAFGAENGEHNFMLAVLFPYEQLRILDYNRAVKGLNGLTEEEFMERIGEYFEVIPDFSRKLPERAHEFGMYLRKGRWYLLKLREKVLKGKSNLSSLDVSVLQDTLLGPVLGIKNPRTDSRIVFIGGVKGASALEDMVERERFSVAFSLFPPSIEQMMSIADLGMVMPPKSTWFEPKLRSGLFVHLIQ